MYVGQEVVYTQDPSLYGKMKVKEIHATDKGQRIVCELGDETEVFEATRQSFMETELDMATKFFTPKTNVPSLTQQVTVPDALPEDF
jgi:hypothetical protein